MYACIYHPIVFATWKATSLPLCHEAWLYIMLIRYIKIKTSYNKILNLLHIITFANLPTSSAEPYRHIRYSEQKFSKRFSCPLPVFNPWLFVAVHKSEPRSGGLSIKGGYPAVCRIRRSY